DWAVAGLDAVHPVFVVAGTLEVLDLILVDRFLEDGVGVADDHAAVDEQLALGADEVDAVLFLGLADLTAAAAHRTFIDHLLVGDDDVVSHLAAPIDDLRAELVVLFLRRNDLDGAGMVHAQGPLGDVVVVRAPVGDVAAGVFAVVAP